MEYIASTSVYGETTLQGTAPYITSFRSYLNISTGTSYQDSPKGQSTCTHELGHALGRNDYNSITNCIMSQARDRQYVWAPMSDDINGVNAIYK